MKAIIQFGKMGRLRYISHLDLQRFMQRALRRSGLPVAYTQGFNPHAIMSFASALGMGVSSECELLEVRMAQEVSEQQVLAAMQSALPPEMPVYRARLVEDRFPALMSMVYCAEYRITLSGVGAQTMMNALPAYLAKEEIQAIRKSKSGERLVNIRPQTLCLEPTGENQLFARLMLTPEDTLKPEVLLGALAEIAGQPEYEAAIHRTCLCAKLPTGATTALFDRQME